MLLLALSWSSGVVRAQEEELDDEVDIMDDGDVELGDDLLGDEGDLEADVEESEAPAPPPVPKVGLTDPRFTIRCNTYCKTFI